MLYSVSTPGVEYRMSLCIPVTNVCGEKGIGPLGSFWDFQTAVKVHKRLELFENGIDRDVKTQINSRWDFKAILKWDH